MLRFFIKLGFIIGVGVYPFIYVGLSGAPIMGCGGDSGAAAEEEQEEDGNALATNDATVSNASISAVEGYVTSTLTMAASSSLSKPSLSPWNHPERAGRWFQL